MLRSLDWLLLGGVAGLVAVGLWAVQGVTRFDNPGHPASYLDRQLVYAAVACFALLVARVVAPDVPRRCRRPGLPPPGGPSPPDLGVANAVVEPGVGQDKIETKGGAFRSRGKWYAMTYACAVTPDHLKVTSFHFTVGDEIPETKWAGYHLWD